MRIKNSGNISVFCYQGFSQNKIEGGGYMIGPIETAGNADFIIARYILYMQVCVCTHNRLPQWGVSS